MQRTLSDRVGSRLRRALREQLSVVQRREIRRTATVVMMGRNSYGNPTVIDHGHPDSWVEIGSFCSVAEGVEFVFVGEHRTDLLTTSPMMDLGPNRPFRERAHRGPVRVEHDVWIGRDATILSGVTIGTGAVIGAKAVVRNDVPPYTIVAGNPARAIRRRFTDQECEILLASKWWEWSDERLRAAQEDLWSTDVARFAERWLPAETSSALVADPEGPGSAARRGLT